MLYRPYKQRVMSEQTVCFINQSLPVEFWARGPTIYWISNRGVPF